LVGGTGMIALFVIQLLKLAGCGKIITFDLDQNRLDLALRLGATHAFRADTSNVYDEVKKITNGRGADIGFEVVGVSPVLKTLIGSMRKGGQITLIGNVSAEVNFPLQQVVTRQLKIQGSCAICGEYETVLGLISRGQIEIAPLISAIAPLKDGAAWFERLYKQEKGLMKVILIP
jgi:L-iditol 2-dehydrogenase